MFQGREAEHRRLSCRHPRKITHLPQRRRGAEKDGYFNARNIHGFGTGVPGGIDIAEIKRRCGDRLCLIGNVNCGLLDTGTDAEAAASARYALRHGMPGGGYIFSTSNCVYTGMRPERYELIWKIWKEEGIYQD